jgi:hypothetical protein
MRQHFSGKQKTACLSRNFELCTARKVKFKKFHHGLGNSRILLFCFHHFLVTTSHCAATDFDNFNFVPANTAAKYIAYLFDCHNFVFKILDL